MRAIDADALEKSLENSCDTDSMTCAFVEFLAYVDDTPTLDVVPRSVYEQIKWERDIAMQQLEENGIAFGAKLKVGKWVYDHWCEFKCSECGYFSKSEPIRGKEKYCPNCGCKMENGEQKEGADNG